MKLKRVEDGVKKVDSQEKIPTRPALRCGSLLRVVVVVVVENCLVGSECLRTTPLPSLLGHAHKLHCHHPRSSTLSPAAYFLPRPHYLVLPLPLSYAFLLRQIACQ